MSVHYFNDKPSEEKFMRLYNIDPSEFYHSGIYEGSKIRQRYLCWKYLPMLRDRVIKESDVAIDSKYEAVFLEFRWFPHIEFILRNSIIKLGDKWSQTVVCGRQNYDNMKTMCESISSNIRIINLDIDGLTPTTSYNDLLTSESFWRSFRGEKILIHQEDSCIFKNNVDDFLKFDYIGAPWDTDKEWVQTSGLKIPAGNGGFSLRTKSIMIQVIQQYPRNPGDEEDVYFSRMIQDHNLGVFPTAFEAYAFSSEGIVNRDSFGGHCYFNYDVESEEGFVRECVLSIYHDSM